MSPDEVSGPLGAGNTGGGREAPVKARDGGKHGDGSGRVKEEVGSRIGADAGGLAAAAARSAAAPPAAPAALPCLNSNNSTQQPPTILTSGHRRTAFALVENVRLLARKFGIDRLGFLTLTFRDHVTCIREAQRRFNSLRTHVLASRYAASIAVPERMSSGRLHFHLLVVCPEDIRTGIDFAAIAAGDYQSAGWWLRAEWAFWRRTAPNFGFGRTELMPVKSTAEAIAKYVGKYIAKHLGNRQAADKGARLVRYTANARQVGTRFAWVGVRPWLWRAKLAKFAAEQRCADFAELRFRFGPRWAFKLAENIAATALNEYPTGVHALADGHDLPPNVDPRKIRQVHIDASLSEKVDWADVRALPFKPPPPASLAHSPVWRSVVRVAGEWVQRGWAEQNSGRFVARTNS